MRTNWTNKNYTALGKTGISPSSINICNFHVFKATNPALEMGKWRATNLPTSCRQPLKELWLSLETAWPAQQFLFIRSSPFSEVKQTFMKVWELNAGEKSPGQSLCRILLPSDAFCYLHPVQVGLLEDTVKLGVLMNAKHHAQPNKLQLMLTPCSLSLQWGFVLLPWISILNPFRRWWVTSNMPLYLKWLGDNLFSNFK